MAIMQQAAFAVMRPIELSEHTQPEGNLIACHLFTALYTHGAVESHL